LFLIFDLEIILAFPFTAVIQKNQNINKNNLLAFLYSTPLCFGIWPSHEKRKLEILYQVKVSLADGVKLHGETQTVKWTEKDENGVIIGTLGISSNLRYILIRITNLVHIVCHQKDLKLTYYKNLRIASIYDIYSINVEKLKLLDDTQSVIKTKINMQGSKYSKPNQGTAGSPKDTPVVFIKAKLNRYSTPLNQGDGIVIVRDLIGRMIVHNRGIK
jgi:hypothetical protein